jgi:hypothetical protein
MAQTLLTFSTRLIDGDTVYRARACGRERADGTWEGWIEFVPAHGGPVLASERETTQPNLVDLQYWATGLTPVYLEGALERTLTRQPRRDSPASEPPAHAAPAPRIADAAPAAILDPFSVFAKGEDLLRRQLRALRRRHLLGIIRTYRLAGEAELDLDLRSEPELIALILTAVRLRSRIAS